MTAPELATCTRCGQEKPVTAFSRNAFRRTGLQSACKACTAARAKELRADGRYKARERRQARAYRQAMTALREAHIDEFLNLYWTAFEADSGEEAV